MITTAFRVVDLVLVQESKNPEKYSSTLVLLIHFDLSACGTFKEIRSFNNRIPSASGSIANATEKEGIMDSLPHLSLLKIEDDTIEFVRKDVNLEKPGRMEDAVNILDDWVKKQSHFLKKDFPREYLERTLLGSKGLLERAKLRLDKYCTYRTTLPEFFRHDHLEETYKILRNFVIHAHVPKLTTEHYRIYITKLLSIDADSEMFFKHYQYSIVLSEYIKTYDYQAGFVVIFDLRDISIMGILAKMNVVEYRQYANIVMDGFGMRLKAVHLITPSKMVDSLISLAKSILSEKLLNRVHVHQSLDTLYEHLEKDDLPSEYGGKERSMRELQDEWYKILISEKFQSYLDELDKAKINESYRQTDKFNDENIGLPGSFRTLVVD